MERILIGVHVDTERNQSSATLGSIHAHTAVPHQVLLIPEAESQSGLPFETWQKQGLLWTTPEPHRGAACFNRLARFDDASVIVLLESGARVGPGWLDHLLAALRLNERNGLAGPSTNIGWNEQAVFSQPASASCDLASMAAEAARRFGAAARTLEPLYSLADFCYAVRREVIQTIGLADEGYGPGPCWEMDYNIRAARAGWRGVWAGAAYVQRAPFTARRQRDEARLFQASKQRYQDKFCGARLRGEKSDYRLHCRGDACPNFAPAPPGATITRGTPNPVAPHSEMPLVSCIMPTCDRLELAREAVAYFLRQDYPNLELVIVDDGAAAVAPALPADPRLRLIRSPDKKNTGAKRNIACAAALGEFIVHWDDDDWYPSDRVTRQITALQSGQREICGTSTLFFHEAKAARAWRYRYARAGRSWVAGNTLAYRKSWWAAHPFEEIQVGEDTRFVWMAPVGKVCDMNAAELCVARIHPGNTSRKQTSGLSWQPHAVAELQSLLGVEWLRFSQVAASAPVAEAMPLVSCIMPTFNRRPFLRLSLELFKGQDYPFKELIVVDDGTDAVRDLVEGLPGVVYLRLPTRAPIGDKRNRACAAAQGAIIAHWDDDDWYAPSRLRHQIAPLLSGQADLTGLENSFTVELSSGRFWRTRADLHRRMFFADVHGGTLVYWKNLLEGAASYPAINLAEDAAFLSAALRVRKRLLRLANDGLFIYVRHGSNAWQFQPGQFLEPSGWESISPPAGFSDEQLTAYQQAAAEGCTTVHEEILIPTVT